MRWAGHTTCMEAEAYVKTEAAKHKREETT
jgi:hypothetical protein